ncbi:hypothetical protein LTS10_002034 [Elasticomyces elasticus]|nr:hypothetical protein LTS10_002034 [Elasticomyces elasticus]
MSRISRYTADKRYPVTQTLADLFYSTTKSRHQNRALQGNRDRPKEFQASDQRNDIVSEKLCDDTIAYLAPTLEKHKGCTIIDIHPGASLWSSKLHDFLQPKCHVLMEPEELYVEPFIKPLLEKPGSTYRHTSLTGAHPRDYWMNYDEVFKNLAPRTALSPDDPALRQIDPNFLVIGNLARQYKVPTRAKSVNFGSLIMQQFLYAALANELFHKGGLVRTLLWLPEVDKYTMFPISEVHRRPLNARLSVGSSITEAVGTLDLYNLKNVFYARRRQRAPVMETVIANRTKRLMDEQHMMPPKDRPLLHDRAHTDLSGFVSPLETTVRTWKQLDQQIDETEARLKEVAEIAPHRGVKQLKSKKQITGKHPDYSILTMDLKYPQCGPVSKTYAGSALNMDAIAIFADAGLRIVNLEVGLCVLSEQDKADDPSDYERARDRIWALDAELEAYATSRSIMVYAFSQQIIEQQLACLVEPPLLALDAREYEPLKALPHEFWPNNQMMLLDMVPKSRDLAVPGLASRHDTAKLCESLLKSLLQTTAQSIPEALDRLSPNAAQDLIPMMPSMKDPRRGGRLNPSRVRTRGITEHIMEDLIKAWIEWPFKPSMTDLELAAESIPASVEAEVSVDAEDEIAQ